MLDATIELISLVSSNSHLVFCFANLIIGFLFVSSSKSVSAPSLFQKVTFPPTTPKKVQIHQKEVDITEAAELVSHPEEVKKCYKKIEEFKNDDGEDEDELGRRAEEFIEKINRSWKAEKLGTCLPSVHSERLEGQFGRRLIV